MANEIGWFETTGDVPLLIFEALLAERGFLDEAELLHPKTLEDM